MAGANSNIQITALDFNDIKTNLKQYLQGQNVLQDYNYEGSALSTLLDILAYNTQYNAYYLNMVANEMFMDSALQRSSVVSHAKLLNYTPKSAIAPSATIDLNVYGVTDPSLTLPKFTRFLSEAIDGVNYTFVTTDSKTVNVISNTASFNDITLKQGQPSALNYTVDSVTNPSYTFEIPETTIDTSTLVVVVQKSGANNYTEVYTPATEYLKLDGESLVYFIQESRNGTYEIYFGDGVLGKKLSDGNIVKVSYIITQGTASADANNFVLMDAIGGYSNNAITPITSATTGGDKESITSIKFQAPKSYSAQGRAVTKEDYITLIQQNELGYSFDAVNVWGGEENDPPVYGQVFICLKPTGAYSLTQTQKQRLIQQVIKPISVMTVEPTIVEPDYTYVKLNVNVVYDPKKTTLTANQISQLVTSSVNFFATNTLNTFNSTFAAPDLTTAIQNADPSIVTNEVKVQLQKKFYPNLSSPQTYNFFYGVELAKGMFLSGINSSPAVQFQNPINKSTVIEGIFIEEVPSATGGVESISVINPGFGYQYAPTVTILGDGTGATAKAYINTTGTIKSIEVVTSGNNYTGAIATLTPNANDTTGQLGAAVVNLQGRYGTLRSYYNTTTNVKTIFNQNIGIVDYKAGLVTLNDFGPIQVDNALGQLTVTINPATTVISSSYNRIITIDPFDPTAITVKVTAKS
jgi:hypothetical protein